MAWQAQVLDTALELDEDGCLVYRDVTLTVPRQSGKSTLLLILCLLRALHDRDQAILYTAQTGADARKKMFDDWWPNLKVGPLKRHISARLTSGHERLRFTTGSTLGLVASTQKSGHGSTIDLAVLDEAFAHPDARLEQALRPALMTRPQPQLWVVSTAGTPSLSRYLHAKVETGRQQAEASLTEGAAYFEWSSEDAADPGDPETWRACMPALGVTVSEAAVAADFRALEVSEFARAYLNRWVVALTDPVIPLEVWGKLVDRSSRAIDPVAMALDVTPDRSRSAIAVAGRREDGLLHVEVIDHRSGTGWVAERLGELVQRHQPSGVYIDPAGPAGSLLADLHRAGVEAETVSSKEMAQACGVFFDAVTQGTLRHLGTPELTAALDGAVKRSLGDAWAWSRKSSSVDISPLVACTLALWGLQADEKPGVVIISGPEWLASKPPGYLAEVARQREEWAAETLRRFREQGHP
jgi:phage terminase large subunit-like protein